MNQVYENTLLQQKIKKDLHKLLDLDLFLQVEVLDSKEDLTDIQLAYLGVAIEVACERGLIEVTAGGEIVYLKRDIDLLRAEKKNH
ncbi:hypothetical protein [Enterococcus olivae]